MATKKVAGHTVWPITYGHIVWLRDLRKNKFILKQTVEDFAIAEICFAFTQEPLALQSIKGATATKRINDLLLSTSPATLTALFTHAIEQFEIHAKTLTLPKKAQAAAPPRRKTAARARKR